MLKMKSAITSKVIDDSCVIVALLNDLGKSALQVVKNKKYCDY